MTPTTPRPGDGDRGGRRGASPRDEPRRADDVGRVPPRGRAALPGLGAVRRLGDHGIGACLQRLDDAIAAATTLGVPTDDAQAVAREVAGRLGFPAETYVLALVGGTGVGKSSLLNALAGSSVSDASVRRPTTAHPLAWVPRSQPRRPGRPARLARRPERKFAITSRTRSATWRSSTCRTSTRSKCEHRERVEAILPRVDAVVWVTDPEKYHDAILHDDFLANWLPRLDRQVVVLNKTDRLTADDAERVRHDLERDLARIGRPRRLAARRSASC